MEPGEVLDGGVDMTVHSYPDGLRYFRWNAHALLYGRRIEEKGCAL